MKWLSPTGRNMPNDYHNRLWHACIHCSRLMLYYTNRWNIDIHGHNAKRAPIYCGVLMAGCMLRACLKCWVVSAACTTSIWLLQTDWSNFVDVFEPSASHSNVHGNNCQSSNVNQVSGLIAYQYFIRQVVNLQMSLTILDLASCHNIANKGSGYLVRLPPLGDLHSTTQHTPAFRREEFCWTKTIGNGMWINEFQESLLLKTIGYLGACPSSFYWTHTCGGLRRDDRLQ